jgi:hypothetical protein
MRGHAAGHDARILIMDRIAVFADIAGPIIALGHFEYDGLSALAAIFHFSDPTSGITIPNPADGEQFLCGTSSRR